MPTTPTSTPLPLRRLAATRYVTALREGGSVPAVVEADDGALYVAKFRAAAQGGRTLAAELIAGEIARAAGLPVPELAFIEVEAALGRSEPHQEIQELLIRSAGTNLAMGYLAGALGYDVAARRAVDPALAAAVVAFDLFVGNVDRTARNPNLLWQGEALWLIDNGASLTWQHGWDGTMTSADSGGVCPAAVRARRRPRAVAPGRPPGGGGRAAWRRRRRRAPGRHRRHRSRMLGSKGSGVAARRPSHLVAGPAGGPARHPRRGGTCPTAARLITWSCRSCRASIATSG